MAVSRCPHCEFLLLTGERQGPACPSCGGALAGPLVKAEPPGAAPTPAALPPMAPALARTPWLLWAALGVLAVSNVAMMTWILWHRGPTVHTAAAQQAAVADVVLPSENPPQEPAKIVNDSHKEESQPPVAPPAPVVPKVDQSAPMPMPMPPAPPPVVVAEGPKPAPMQPPAPNPPVAEGPKPPMQPAAPPAVAENPKPPAPMPPAPPVVLAPPAPPPMPAPMPPPPAVAAAPMPPPVFVPPAAVPAVPAAPLLGGIDLANIEGMQGRIDCNDIGDVIALRLGGADLDDNDLILLKVFDSLRDLNLDHTAVVGKGLLQLSRLKELRSLSLRGDRVTGPGLEELPGLTELDLSDTPIDDVGLEFLHELTGLRKLNLSKTHVTDAGVEALKKALPGVKIAR